VEVLPPEEEEEEHYKITYYERGVNKYPMSY
jgi:hypothetical protein